MKPSLLLAISTIILLSYSCESGYSLDENNFSQYTEVDYNDNNSIQYLDEIPSENYSVKDFTLENGNNLFDFLNVYDPLFLRENEWIEHYSITSGRNSQNSVTGNAGIINLKNTVINEMVIGSIYFLNDSKGFSTNNIVANKISDNNQKGLWYKWGGKEWNLLSFPTKGGEPKTGDNLKCYGLDCSGLVYSSMNNIGFNIPVKNANGYYSENIWNEALQKFLMKKNKFPEEIKGNLKFKKFTYKCNDLVEKAQPGDILFFGTSNIGHIGIVSNTKKLSQSNGQQHPDKAEYNYYHEIKKTFRGPRLISLTNVANPNYWGVKEFGVLRLVAELDDTHWRLNIKCEGKNSYITSFDLKINMQEDKNESIIEPIYTTGYDYTGEECSVYFEGTYNMETQTLKGSVRKDYGNNDYRIDGFEVRLLDDNTKNITMTKIKSNGGCYNILDLVSLDSYSAKEKTQKIELNNSRSTNGLYECSDSNE